MKVPSYRFQVRALAPGHADRNHACAHGSDSMEFTRNGSRSERRNDYWRILTHYSVTTPPLHEARKSKNSLTRVRETRSAERGTIYHERHEAHEQPVAAGIPACCRAVASSPAERVVRIGKGFRDFVSPASSERSFRAARMPVRSEMLQVES